MNIGLVYAAVAAIAFVGLAFGYMAWRDRDL